MKYKIGIMLMEFKENKGIMLYCEDPAYNLSMSEEAVNYKNIKQALNSMAAHLESSKDEGGESS